jgi:hypothetical protein
MCVRSSELLSITWTLTITDLFFLFLTNTGEITKNTSGTPKLKLILRFLAKPYEKSAEKQGLIYK